MGYILMIYFIAIITIVVFYIKSKTLINIVTIFNIIWIFLITLSYQGYYGLYVPQDETYMILFSGILSFNLGILVYIFKVKKFVIKKPLTINSKLNHRISKMLIFIQVLISFIMFPQLIKALTFINIKGLGALRALKVQGVLNQILIFAIADPLINFSIILSSILFIYNRKINMPIVFTIINVLIYLFSFGGRLMLFKLVIIYFVIYKINSSEDKFKIRKKSKKFNIIMMALILIFIYIIYKITIIRQGNDYTFLKSLTVYFVGPISLFDVLRESGFTEPVNYFFGAATIAGLLDGVLQALILLGFNITTNNLIIVQINEIISKNFYIGNNIKINAFTTMYYTFMNDFGFLGVILIPFIFALILMYFRNKLIENTTIFNLSIYSLLFYIAIFTPLRWEFIQQWPWYTIFYLLIMKKIYEKAN